MRDPDADEMTAMEEDQLTLWAQECCERWNWNADIAEIAKELIDQDVDTDSHQFTVLCKVFNKFFNQPKVDVTEAIEQIMTTFS